MKHIEFKQGQIVKYKGFNDKTLNYKILHIWQGGFGYYDLSVDGKDANYDGHFYPEYLSVPYSELRKANEA